jgi:hypothetical protein
MMVKRSWIQTRSEFSHTWLKNRVIIALWKAQNVLAGSVKGESIWQDLDSLLSEWHERRGEAEWVLANFVREASPAKALSQPGLSSLEHDIRKWLGHLVDLRWKEVESPGVKAARAKEALDMFDQQVRVFSSEIEAILQGREAENAQPYLANFQAAAKTLSEAFAELAPVEL